MLLVPFGTFDQDSGGEVSLPSHVYSTGMVWFAANAFDVTFNDMFVVRWVEGFSASASALVSKAARPAMLTLRTTDPSATHVPFASSILWPPRIDQPIRILGCRPHTQATNDAGLLPHSRYSNAVARSRNHHE
ncbi:MAG: hypothetical protein JWO36_1252 [Myxococcales bacterium]|nr:hypothetical protein [Myxococcales bacterium]